MIFKTGDNAITAMTIDGVGNVLKPVQPAFQAIPGAAQNNIAIDTAVTIVLGTEVFDQGGDFADDTFTAPYVGKYIVHAR